MQEKNYLQLMIESLEKKKMILSQIIDYNEDQLRILDSPDFDDEAFDVNLHDKGDKIDALNRLDEGFQSLFEKIKIELEKNKSQYYNEIRILQSLIKEVTELGARIEVQESRNKVKVEDRFLKEKEKLKKAKRSTSMANTYYRNMSNMTGATQASQFLDQKK